MRWKIHAHVIDSRLHILAAYRALLSYKWIPMECDTRGKNSVYYVDVIAQEYWVDTKVLQWSINPFWVGLAEFDFYLICMHWELIPDDPVKNNDSKAHIGNTVYCNQPSKQSS